MKKPPKLPTYNPAVNGNPFMWIVQTSAKIRKENINGQGGHAAHFKLDPLTGRPPIRPL